VSNTARWLRPRRTRGTQVPGVHVFRPEPAPDAGLVLAGTTQAIQDAII